MSTDIAWRKYLDELIRHKSAAKKKQLYQAVGVTRTAFQRWRTGEHTPDAAHVSLLLDALADEERTRLRTLMRDDPRAQALLPTELAFLQGQPAEHIPQSVYEEVLRLGRDTPDRFWMVGGSILFHALSQMETHPDRTGVNLSIARCMPARSDGKIRSLRLTLTRGTPPWRSDLHSKEMFLGAEALAGFAVMHAHGVMVPDRHAEEGSMPIRWGEHERSCAAFPIRREGGMAGALVVSCCQPHFFTQEKLTLIEHYADLLRLAFYDQEFVPTSSIDLGLMPPCEVQKPYLASFRQRVTEEYQRAVREERSLEPLAHIEARVRSALEGELLLLASQSGEGIVV